MSESRCFKGNYNQVMIPEPSKQIFTGPLDTSVDLSDEENENNMFRMTVSLVSGLESQISELRMYLSPGQYIFKRTSQLR